MTNVGIIAEIRRYPVKSMQGERLQHATLTELGISGDRTFAVRDLTTQKILSGKTPKVGVALLSCAARTEPEGNTIITVDGVDFAIDNPALNATLSALLDRDVRIERAIVADGGTEEMYETYWPEIEGLALSDVTVDLPIAMSTKKGTFVDLAALHILTTGSFDYLKSLNGELELSIDRFRPGILIATETKNSFVEKQWVNQGANIGEASIAFGSESPRCIMTTLEQQELPRQPAVLQTIAKHNRSDFAGFGNFACLGIYGEVTASGEIAVGDNVSLNG